MEKLLRVPRKSICCAETTGKSKAIFNIEHNILISGFLTVFIFAGFIRLTAQNCSVKSGDRLNEAVGRNPHEVFLNRENR